MPDYHNRGRTRDRHYDDGVYDYDDDYGYYVPERRARKRSLSTRAMDKIEDVFAGLGLTDRHSTTGGSSTGRHRRHSSSSSSAANNKALVVQRPHSPPARQHHHHRSHDRARSRHSHGSSSHHHHHHSGSGHHHHHHHTRRTYSASPTRHSSRRSARHSSRPRSRSRSRPQWERSLKAASNAVALEAYRLRKEPGPWLGGQKGSRIATAAISAAAIGAAVDDRTGEGKKESTLGTVGSALGGLVVNRVVNGPRRDVR